MLDFVRNLVSSIFGKFLLAIMVLSFALWGVGDILSSGNSQLAAKIGNEKITLDEFYNEFQKTVRNYNQSTQSNLTLKEAYKLNLHAILINELVYSKMINSYAKNKNIILSNESLKLVIKDLPQFKNSKGNFSETLYRNYIINNFPSEELFLTQLENIIYQDIIFENFNANNYINKNIIDALFKYETESRSISYIIFNKDEIKVKTDSSLIKNFYEDNKNNYLVNEKILIDYIEIKLDDFSKPENISSNEIVNYYNNNIDQYTQSENRDIEFIRFPDIESAWKFYNNFNNQDDLKYNEFASNLEYKINLIENFTGDTFPNEITNEIFKIKNNNISEPIKYDDLGFYIFNILKINEQNIIKLEKVSEEIKQYLSLNDAYIQYDETINMADDMLLKDFSFEEIASSLSNISKNEQVSFDEFKNKFENTEISYNDEPIGYVSGLIIDENVAYIYTVKNKKEAYIPQLIDINNSVVNDFAKEEIYKELLSIADELLLDNKLSNYKSLEKYANANNLLINKIDKLKRTDSYFSIETMNYAFESEIEKPFKVVKSDEEIGIGIIQKISNSKIDNDNEDYKMIMNNIKNNYNSSMESLLINEIITNSKYEIYEQNIDKLFM